MSRVKPAEVSFYLDADLLGLAHVLAALRPDVTFPGDPGIVIHKRERPPCPVLTPAAKDTEWIPVAAQNRWLIITRDRRIQEHRGEIIAVRESGARMVALSGPDARGTFEQLEIVMIQWRAITQLLTKPGPFIYTATRTSLRAVSLD
ncbi:hypothetical protein [Actinoplanes utahensis]|uniref:VapC45 PIN like domain-containing protein n=1 Tax=Actinoplanes utahensis TaxID=1869 RepID=A0A0A6UWV5_ACTUT|nr:hypothetical protein [Actinoplanes utahensis]KHD78894.1 hypothetical protein MB27_01965 [Actinoplanes utahensis]GIF28154.1 hypothetical protein Aut01nite_11400 [Actinoplanes utahensis]